MTNNPKQPRGPGGKFVKAVDHVDRAFDRQVAIAKENAISKARKAPLIIVSEIDTQDAKAGVETILTARGQRKIDNYIKRFGGDCAQIISDMHAAKVSSMHRNPIAIPIESTPGVDCEFSTDDIVPISERFARNIGKPGDSASNFDKLNSALEGAHQRCKDIIDQLGRDQLDHARRMKWIGITLGIVLLSMLIVAAALWIKL